MKIHHAADKRSRTIGFRPSSIRMEEEEEQGATYPETGKAETLTRVGSEALSRALVEFTDERQRIIALIGDQKIEKDVALKLLAGNQELIAMMRGLSPYKFGTEKVIYSLLVFSAVVILTLALLNATGKVSVEVTTTFMGTVVGGTLTTIAQKLGKIGR